MQFKNNQNYDNLQNAQEIIDSKQNECDKFRNLFNDLCKTCAELKKEMDARNKII